MTAVIRATFATLLAVLGVLVRRMLGRRSPGQRLPVELIVAAQRAGLTALLPTPPAVIRSFASRGSLADPKTLKRVQIRATSLGGVNVECTEPLEHPPKRTVFYIHGGGYCLGSPTTHQEITARIADEAQARVWSIDYRLAPEHRWPAAIEDVQKAWRALVAAGTDPARTVVGGDSAGGALTLALMLRLRDTGSALPAGGVPISPAVNVADWGWSFDTNYATDYITREMCEVWVGEHLRPADRRDPLISPAFGDPRGLPPLLVHAGAAETLISQIDAYVEKARAAGVKVDYSRREGMFHVWHLFARFLPEGRESISAIASWIRARTP